VVEDVAKRLDLAVPQAPSPHPLPSLHDHGISNHKTALPLRLQILDPETGSQGPMRFQTLDALRD
jgi:hypothetical protein